LLFTGFVQCNQLSWQLVSWFVVLGVAKQISHIARKSTDPSINLRMPL